MPSKSISTYHSCFSVHSEYKDLILDRFGDILLAAGYSGKTGKPFMMLNN